MSIIKVIIDTGRPQPAKQQAEPKQCLAEKVEACIKVIEATMPEYDDCEHEWKFLMALFDRLSKNHKKLSPELSKLLTVVEDAAKKHGMFKGDYAPNIDAQQLNKGMRD